MTEIPVQPLAALLLEGLSVTQFTLSHWGLSHWHHMLKPFQVVFAFNMYGGMTHKKVSLDNI